MISTCLRCREEFAIPSDDLEFYGRNGTPPYNGVRFSYPPPKYCPDCRRQRRLAFRNERFLYKRTCDFSGKPIYSVYSPDKPLKVYDREIWWSDRWNPLDYGVGVDFSRLFFDQFAEVQLATPVPSLRVVMSENCDFNHYLEKSKNCYLVFNGQHNFDCMYLQSSSGCRDTLDSYRSGQVERCYHMYRGSNCTNCFYCDRIGQCDDCYFCKLCGDCRNCFGCYCIRHREYCIFNKQYTKKEYFDFIRKIDFGSYAEMQRLKVRCRSFWDTMPINPTSGEFNDDCFGDYVYYANFCYLCFTISNCDRCKYCFELSNGNLCYDLDCTNTASDGCQQVVSASNIHNLAFCRDCWTCSESYYLANCIQCNNCFGCVGLYNKKYCILNRQYTQSEYNELVPKIIRHMQETEEWGEFFPFHLSQFGYNETEASFHFPLTREEALSGGLVWSDYENPRPKVDKVIKAADLPDHISAVSNEILDYAIECEVTGRLFKVQARELEFYRTHKIPLPRRHPEQRQNEMRTLRNPLKYVTRRCQCVETDHNHKGRCELIVQSTFPIDYPENVVCTPCLIQWQYE